MIALINDAPGIGDKLQFAALPEIFHDNTNEKIVDVSRCWVYDYNPFVIRENIPCEQHINLWGLSHTYKQVQYLSTSERFFKNTIFKDFKINLRHPRLYRFEDLKTIPNRIVIHTTGKSEGGSISDEALKQIEKRYSHFEVIQVGGKNDKPTNFINKLGLGIWETVEIIASASIFIGIDSGAGMGIANCYPRVNRKIILNRNDMDTISPLNPYTGWLDFNVQYFNQTEHDMGTTYSYKKI
jgi:hypothetical protein